MGNKFHRMEPAREYQIRLYRDDGSLSMVMLFMASRDSIAEHEAERMLNGELTSAHIWNGDKLVRTLHSVNGRPVAR